MKRVSVVKYKGQYFVWYRTNKAGKAQLIDAEGKKYTGTPHAKSIKDSVVKLIDCKQFNNGSYFKTKIGVFSCQTGNRILDEGILKLFR